MAQVTHVAEYLKKSLLGITDVNYVLASYDGEIAYADSELARLLQAVDLDKTLVMVIGDHGESLGEHGVWFNHGDDVYETSVHVPLAIRYPARIPAGRVVTAVFEGTDVAPTVLGLLDIDPPDTFTGKSAEAAIDAGDIGLRSVARAMCFDRDANQAARKRGEITDPKYRMVSLRKPATRCVATEIDKIYRYYDLQGNPSGVNDVLQDLVSAPGGVALYTDCQEDAESLFSGTATERSGGAELSEEEQERLRALGYLEP